ncbi:hypothetical protein IWZ00DRAFT_323348 [Phyllosticta capitalensis]
MSIKVASSLLPFLPLHPVPWWLTKSLVTMTWVVTLSTMPTLGGRLWSQHSTCSRLWLAFAFARSMRRRCLDEEEVRGKRHSIDDGNQHCVAMREDNVDSRWTQGLRSS